MYFSNCLPRINVIHIDCYRETVDLMRVVENAEVDDQQFFIKVDTALLVHRVHIKNGLLTSATCALSALNQCIAFADSARPVDFVVT